MRTTPETRKADDVTDRRRRGRALKLVALTLGLVTVFGLEYLFLLLAPSVTMSAKLAVYIFLGVLVGVVLLSDLVSWALFAGSLARLFRGDRRSNGEEA